MEKVRQAAAEHHTRGTAPQARLRELLQWVMADEGVKNLNMVPEQIETLHRIRKLILREKAGSTERG